MVMMLRRSHPGRGVQGGAATCWGVLGRGQQEEGEDQGQALSFQRQGAISGVTSPRQGQGQGQQGLSRCRTCRQASRESRREKKKEEAMEEQQGEEELNGKGAEGGKTQKPVPSQKVCEPQDVTRTREN